MQLPTLPEVERLILGCCLQGFRLDVARAEIETDYFATKDHQRVWDAICKLYDGGNGVDHIAVGTDLVAAGVRNLGGEMVLTFLLDLTQGAPDQPEIVRHIDRLRDAALRRRMILAAQQLALKAADTTQAADDVLSSFAAVSTDLAAATDSRKRPVSTHDLIVTRGVGALLGPRAKGSFTLPWSKLNEDLRGLSGGQLIVLMAATSRGKTSMALQIATAAAVQNHPPVIWTMEMSPESLFKRMVQQLSGVGVGRKFFTRQESEAHSVAVAQLDESPIYFDRHSRSVGSFMASLRQVKSRSRVGVAIVDYLQLIRAGASRSRAQEVSDNSRSLKLAAMDLDIPFVVLSQVDRSSVKGDTAKIGLHSAKESGDVENDADVVLWIEAGELSREHDTPVSLHVGKQREGPAGFSVPMVFRPQSQIFVEL